MKKIFYLMAALILSSSVYGQTINRRAKVLYDLGCENIIKKRYFEAIFCFTEAINLDPDFIQAYENRGVAKFHLSDNSGAIADYNQALEINPDDYSTIGRRGFAEFFMKDYYNAVADFTKAMEGTPDKLKYYDMRAQSYYFLDKYEEAKKDLNKIIKSLGSGKAMKGNAYYLRGLIEIELGNTESGCHDLKHAKKLGNADAEDAVTVYCE